ncbi:MAG: hypothetical protein ACK419_06485, partial [Pyrinomonadaceae bacterium]
MDKNEFLKALQDEVTNFGSKFSTESGNWIVCPFDYRMLSECKIQEEMSPASIFIAQKSRGVMSLDINLENWLWEAACVIRGPVDAPKFKDYI